MNPPAGVAAIAAECGLQNARHTKLAFWWSGSLAACRRAAALLGLDAHRISATSTELSSALSGEFAGEILQHPDGTAFLRVTA